MKSCSPENIGGVVIVAWPEPFKVPGPRSIVPSSHSTVPVGTPIPERSAGTAAVTCYRASYEPSLTVFVQGRKRINLGGTIYICDGSSFLLSSIDVPAESQIVEASEQVPMLSMFFQLDMPMVREVISREELPEPAAPVHSQGLAVGETTSGLLGACTRLIDLLEIPEDVPFLSHLILREIVYRVLRTPQGERLRAIATTGDLSHRTARAIAWLRANYAKPLRMDELAAVARMGVSTLHHQFRGLTAMSPLQYQKQTPAADGKAAHAHGRDGCHERGIRSRLREREPVQPRVQPFLRAATHARCQDSAR